MSKKTKQRTTASVAKQRRISTQDSEFAENLTMLFAQHHAAQNSQLLRKKKQRKRGAVAKLLVPSGYSGTKNYLRSGARKRIFTTFVFFKHGPVAIVCNDDEIKHRFVVRIGHPV